MSVFPSAYLTNSIKDYIPRHRPHRVQVCINAHALVTTLTAIHRCGRGNIFLESAAPLAKSLHQEIVSLGRRIEDAATIEEDLHSAIPKSKVATSYRNTLTDIVSTIKGLLDRIDREIPLLQLAITASGETLSTYLPTGISPSRLLQSSTFLIVGDTQFAQDPNRAVQIGPAFKLSLYMLFLGHASTAQTNEDPSKNKRFCNGSASRNSQARKGIYGLEEGERRPLWQEVLHKARVRLCRTRADYVFDEILGYRHHPRTPKKHTRKLSSPQPRDFDEYTYHLEIIEDLDDGRVHDDEVDCGPYDEIASAGIRESIPIQQISKIFYTDTGRILNIGSASEGEHNPVLLLKRDMQAATSDKPPDGLVSYLDTLVADEEDATIEMSHLMEDEGQAAGEKQIRRESRDFQRASIIEHTQAPTTKWRFPSHLDPEWIALEVFEEDDDDSLEPDEEGSTGLAEDDVDNNRDAIRRLRPRRGRSSLDSTVIDQIKRLSIGTSSNPSTPKRNSLQKTPDSVAEVVNTQDFVARSPFGTITTSLSLMEMLIRLASLQEFQQASHLSIPDHVLTFFLEETSTTGLIGETQWKTRSEAKRRMGFDPYTDTPTK